eukprot:CAMPEP_0180788736 /NCGR_PEP_ID=MMETSP1038_2-20121128/52189_1 /TAXON_ID=632150 /ORGANISM="Azadinium spinosum, Strain 3D9" /LENGTH=55 /DNA_ID=CAMNT_0022826337 /DNA_START=25 /DNA_END=192 /DNA_ORIENTATION=-
MPPFVVGLGIVLGLAQLLLEVPQLSLHHVTQVAAASVELLGGFAELLRMILDNVV